MKIKESKSYKIITPLYTAILRYLRAESKRLPLLLAGRVNLHLRLNVAVSALFSYLVACDGNMFLSLLRGPCEGSNLHISEVATEFTIKMACSGILLSWQSFT
jgi:hypothetical protein